MHQTGYFIYIFLRQFQWYGDSIDQVINLQWPYEQAQSAYNVTI